MSNRKPAQSVLVQSKKQGSRTCPFAEANARFSSAADPHPVPDHATDLRPTTPRGAPVRSLNSRPQGARPRSMNLPERQNAKHHQGHHHLHSNNEWANVHAAVPQQDARLASD